MIVPLRDAFASARASIWSQRGRHGTAAITFAEFFSTALLLGPLFVRDTRFATAAWRRQQWLARAGSRPRSCSSRKAGSSSCGFSDSEVFELRASALLLASPLQRAFLMRLRTCCLPQDSCFPSQVDATGDCSDGLGR